MINVADDNGNTTTYEYDNLNRLVKRKFFYSGWRVVEERQQEVEVGRDSNPQFLSEQWFSRKNRLRGKQRSTRITTEKNSLWCDFGVTENFLTLARQK